MKRIKDKFDGWKVIDNELLRERRMQMKPPFHKKKVMAEKLKIDPNLIKAYEDGTKFPSLSTFKKLCLYLQLSADVLLGLDVVSDSLNDLNYVRLQIQHLKERSPQNQGGKGKIPWNKGKKGVYVHSKEIKQKMRDSSCKKFTKEQELEICKQYEKEKVSCNTLAKRWKCNYVIVRTIILRNGGKLRSLKEAQNTEKTKEKMSISAIQRVQTQRGSYKDTKPELKMKDILNELNIPFKHQFRLGNHLFDFHILNTNILIEVDGDYWHGNPKIFSKLNKIQQRIKQKDIQNEKLAKANNFILLRFWENNILNSTNKVVEKLFNAIKDCG